MMKLYNFFTTLTLPSVICWMFIIFASLILLWDVLTKRYKSRYDLTLYIGLIGAGKTTILSSNVARDLKLGRPVYTNVEIPGTHYITADYIGFYKFPPESAIHLDEAGMDFDNRDFKTFKKEQRDYFKNCRHDRNHVSLYSQTLDVDLKIRSLLTRLYVVKKYARVWTVARLVERTIGPASALRKDSQRDTSGGASAIIDSFDYASILTPKALLIRFIPSYAGLFDSFVDLAPVDPKKAKDAPVLVPMTPDVQERLNYLNSSKFYKMLFQTKRFASWVVIKIKSIGPKLNSLKEYIKTKFDNDEK